jgi:cbb3-type cytochrome oxidase subunit 3
MKLSDVMSAMHFNVFAEVALLIALAGFVAVVTVAFLARNREPFERARRMPLDDAAVAPRGEQS